MTVDDRLPMGRWLEDVQHRYQARLLNYVTRLIGNSDRAADILQDTYVRLAQQDPRTLNGHLTQWLYTVCRRRAIDHCRQDRRVQSLIDEPVNEVTHAEISAEDKLSQREEASRVMAAVAQLSDRQQEVLRLKFEHELSYREIAGVMELSVSHVGVLLHTALKSLRKQFAVDNY